LVAATGRGSWKRVPWLTFVLVVPLTLVSIVLAVPIALLVALTRGLSPTTFWTSAIQNLEVSDLVVGTVRSGLFGLVLYGLARLLLGYLHAQVRSTYWKLIVAWLIVGCALVPVDVILSMVRAA
jgi:ABC-type sulfate transport system permease component